MHGTIARIGVTGAGALLAVGLLAASPAGANGAGHHEKSERSATASCFDTSGKTQGRSFSDPDGDSNGGPDKPGCNGAADDDRDGNNGCGNDADREDDNNGHCGGRSNADRANGFRVEDDEAPAPSTTTTTTAPEAVVVTPDVVVSPDEPTDCEIDPKEAEGCEKPTASDGATTDTVNDDATDTTTDTSGTVTDDSTDADSTTEAPASSDEQPAPLAKAGLGFGGLALLGGLVRLLLRIG